MTLTDELGDTPPPSHAWMAPVVEDMLHEVRAGLMEAVVMGPGRAILFYGRHSMGKGLRADKARDATFLLTGAGTWVGKSAYLTANPMMLQEGKRAITPAVSDHRVKAREPGCPRVNLPAQQPVRFITSRTSPPGDALAHYSSDEGQTPRWLPKAEGVIGDGETSDLSHLGSPPLLQTVALKVIEAQYPWRLQYHPVQIAWMDPDVLDKARGIEKRHI